MTLVMACSFIEDEPSPLIPGSQWRVVAIDGERTAADELLLTFIGDTATLSSPCGAGVSEVTTPAVGPELRFGPFDGPAAGLPCPADVLDLHERVAAALEGVERWGRAGSTTELHGEHVIRIERQRTDT